MVAVAGLIPRLRLLLFLWSDIIKLLLVGLLLVRLLLAMRLVSGLSGPLETSDERTQRNGNANEHSKPWRRGEC